MTTHDPSRRRFLKTTGGTLALGVVAGCLGDDDGNGNADGNGNDNPDDDYGFGDWFDDVDNYDGVSDHTGEEEATVMVGTGSDGFQYDPPAIAVDAGTTVVWEWTGDGGGHDVVAEDGDFESEMHTDEGETFEYTFEDEGTYEYYCSPHVNQGMKGAVVVE